MRLKKIIPTAVLVMCLLVTGCEKREADARLEGELDYMPYESVESADVLEEIFFKYL